MSFELFFFIALGIVAITSAAAMLISKNAVHSALFLIANFGCVALLYLMLDAPFLSMVQIAVYAGAIMVLFLFVIMLLGAEQTSDTSRPFRWVAGAATALAASFIFALSVPLALTGGFELPEPVGNAPLVRVVHAANVEAPVDVTIAGGDLEEALLIEGLTFSDVTDFVQLPQEEAEYTVILSSDGVDVATLPLNIAPNDILTVVAHGDAVGNEVVGADDTTTVVYDLPFAVTVLPSDLTDSGNDEARMQIVNLYTEDPIVLVDTGRDRVLSVRENSDEIIDPVLVSELGYAEVAEPITYDEGTYPLEFYTLDDGEYIDIVSLEDWEVTPATEQIILLVPDYASTAGEEGYRPRVLDRNQETLAIPTAEAFGSPRDIGLQLFTINLLPVNLVGFLLLVALVGVIVLTRPKMLFSERRSVRNRRRKVSRPLVSVISQQTGGDVFAEQPKLQDPDAGE